MTFNSREIILGVGGGISAYKSAELLRRLQDKGFNVTVVPTQASLNFVGVATWQALSGREVPTNLWNNTHEVAHISMARQASAIIIAPTTFDLIGKIANGIANDLLTNIVAASTAQLILVPAMHTEMWLNQANQENVEKLRARGVIVIEPEFGKMTGEDVGIGRYPEVSGLIESISTHLNFEFDLKGKSILITAGGTREAIDPVRFIGNRSSGKQGYAIAKRAYERGADVTLISANVELASIPGIEIIKVESATDLYDVMKRKFSKADILLMAAAVADARPAELSDLKIKKGSLNAITLVENEDILASISQTKSDKQVVVAFAAETMDDLEAEGKRKLFAKGADLIYVNNVSNGAIFGSRLTSGLILDRHGFHKAINDLPKDTLADELLNLALNKLG
jgi:phosphopantothenoylcysteine decarboxylase/phosphopantothenate--cysteine ligase